MYYNYTQERDPLRHICTLFHLVHYNFILYIIFILHIPVNICRVHGDIVKHGLRSFLMAKYSLLRKTDNCLCYGGGLSNKLPCRCQSSVNTSCFTIPIQLSPTANTGHFQHGSLVCVVMSYPETTKPRDKVFVRVASGQPTARLLWVVLMCASLWRVYFDSIWIISFHPHVGAPELAHRICGCF